MWGKRNEVIPRSKWSQQIDLLLLCIDFFKNTKYKERTFNSWHSHNNSNPSDVEKLQTQKGRKKTGKRHIEYTFHRSFLLCYYIAFSLELCCWCWCCCCLVEMAFDINHMYRAITIIVLSLLGFVLLLFCFSLHSFTNKL